jgi:hypothetical protein
MSRDKTNVREPAQSHVQHACGNLMQLSTQLQAGYLKAATWPPTCSSPHSQCMQPRVCMQLSKQPVRQQGRCGRG